MNITRSLSCLLLSSFLAAPLLAASDGSAGQACRGEIQKLCGSVKPGDGQLRACIDQHRAEFSPACQQQMTEHKERAQKKAEACRADVEQFCRGIEPGGGRVVRCLKDNEAKLTPACRDSLARHKSRPRDRRDPQP